MRLILPSALPRSPLGKHNLDVLSNPSVLERDEDASLVKGNYRGRRTYGGGGGTKRKTGKRREKRGGSWNHSLSHREGIVTMDSYFFFFLLKTGNPQYIWTGIMSVLCFCVTVIKAPLGSLSDLSLCRWAFHSFISVVTLGADRRLVTPRLDSAHGDSATWAAGRGWEWTSPPNSRFVQSPSFAWGVESFCVVLEENMQKHVWFKTLITEIHIGLSCPKHRDAFTWTFGQRMRTVFWGNMTPRSYQPTMIQDQQSMQGRSCLKIQGLYDMWLDEEMNVLSEYPHLFNSSM